MEEGGAVSGAKGDTENRHRGRGTYGAWSRRGEQHQVAGKKAFEHEYIVRI